MSYPVSEKEREELRALMPMLLEKKLGVTNLRRLFRCPNLEHEDITPSASYYSDTHTVHCFGCGGTWDVFSLVGMLEGITGFVEQAKRVASEVGYCLSGDPDKVRPSASPRSLKQEKPLFPRPKETCFHVDFDTCFEMYKALFTSEGNVARDYLHKRGIDDETITKHGLGFAEKPSELIPEFSIYEPKAEGFAMIPFYDKGCASANYCIARPVGSASATRKEWRLKGVPTTLWHEWLLRAQAPVLYVAEGVLDAMSLEKQLQKPCVALCGIANASRLCSILYHMSSSQRPAKLMIAMDEDDAGHAAASKLAESLNKIGIPHALVPPYPNGEKDANEWHLSEQGVGWTYETDHLGDGITPTHIIRSIRHE